MRKLYITKFFAFLAVLILAQNTQAQEPPYLAPILDQTATINELFTLDVNAQYGSPPITYDLIDSRPGMTINPTTGLISWIPTSNGDGGVVTVKAINSAGEHQRSFLIYITDAVICADDLISYWKFDEPTGTTYTDFQGGYTATTLTGLVDTIGMVDRAKAFTPLGTTDQYVYVDDEGQYDFPRAGGFSVSLWFRYHGQHTGTDNNQVLVARGSPTTGVEEICFILMVNVSSNPANPRITYSLRPKSPEELKSVTPSTTIMENEWYHVVAVYEGSPGAETTYMRIYINTVKSSYAHAFQPYDFVASGQFDLNIGYWDRYPTNRYPFNGIIDEVLVYDRALSDMEVTQIYNDGIDGDAHCRPGNYYPLFTTTPVTEVFEDEPYTYTCAANDYDGGAVQLSAEEIPDWLSFNTSTGLLSGTPDNDDVGDHDVVILATDGTTDIYQEFTIRVVNVNDPPVISSIPDTVVQENAAYTYFIDASDPDNDVLQYEVETIPSWLEYNASSKVLIGIPSRSDVGEHPVRIVVSDGELEAIQEFSIEVLSDNNTPIFTSNPPLIVDNYALYFYSFSAYDADPGDVLTFEAVTIPAWLTFDGVAHTLSGTPEKSDVGDHPVEITVTDGYEVVPQEFTINVRDVNTPPEIISEPEDTAKVDMLYTYLMEVIDYEGDLLTFTGLVIPNWLEFDNNTHVLSGTPALGDVGPHNVIITVSDGMFTLNDQFLITVVPQQGVGFEENRALLAKIYPNPTSGYVTFEFAGEPSSIEISDLSGKVLIQRSIESGETSVQLDVSDFGKGIYMFRVFETDQVQTGKLIVN